MSLTTVSGLTSQQLIPGPVVQHTTVTVVEDISRSHRENNSINIQGSNNERYSDFTLIQNQIDSLFSTRNLVLVLVVIQVIDKIVPLAKAFFGFGWILSSLCVIVLVVGLYHIAKPIYILTRDFFIYAYLMHMGREVDENPYSWNFILRRLGFDTESRLS